MNNFNQIPNGAANGNNYGRQNGTGYQGRNPNAQQMWQNGDNMKKRYNNNNPNNNNNNNSNGQIPPTQPLMQSQPVNMNGAPVEAYVLTFFHINPRKKKLKIFFSKKLKSEKSNFL